MSIQIIVRNLVTIKCLLKAQRNYDDPEFQQTFKALDFILEQQMKNVSNCIKDLENIKSEKETNQDKITSVIEPLKELISN